MSKGMQKKKVRQDEQSLIKSAIYLPRNAYLAHPLIIWENNRWWVGNNYNLIII
jgi:hypothetical protein